MPRPRSYQLPSERVIFHPIQVINASRPEFPDAVSCEQKSGKGIMGIYESQTYARLNEDEIFAQLACEGYAPRRVNEVPGSVYDCHRNDCDLVLAFLRGSAEVRVGDHVYHCVAGDKLNIPGVLPHSAVVGTEGVVYLMTQLENCAD